MRENIAPNNIHGFIWKKSRLLVHWMLLMPPPQLPQPRWAISSQEMHVAWIACTPRQLHRMQERLPNNIKSECCYYVKHLLDHFTFHKVLSYCPEANTRKFSGEEGSSIPFRCCTTRYIKNVKCSPQAYVEDLQRVTAIKAPMIAAIHHHFLQFVPDLFPTLSTSESSSVAHPCHHPVVRVHGIQVAGVRLVTMAGRRRSPQMILTPWVKSLLSFLHPTPLLLQFQWWVAVRVVEPGALCKFVCVGPPLKDL